jgi:hypothetical protein
MEGLKWAAGDLGERRLRQMAGPGERILGLWRVIAPWVLGFGSLATAAWNHVMVGLLMLAFAAREVWDVRQKATASAHQCDRDGNAPVRGSWITLDQLRDSIAIPAGHRAWRRCAA